MVLRPRWDFVCESTFLKLNGKQILFTHMPTRRLEGYWGSHFAPDRNVHGHLHGDYNRHCSKETYDPEFHYDVAPDTHDYQLVDLEHIISLTP